METKKMTRTTTTNPQIPQTGAYYQLPELPFAKDSLEPSMSAETIEFHFEKHHKGYVDKLNKLIIGSGFEDQPLEVVIRQAKGPLFNNAAQVWNHTFFWNCLNPESTEPTSGEFIKAVQTSFGSFEEFKAQFSKQAEQHFGSGWVWLAKNAEGQLVIQALSNAENPLIKKLTPILTIDVWEHAYYIDYRNARKEFIQNFWKVVNWDFVQKQFSLATTASKH